MAESVEMFAGRLPQAVTQGVSPVIQDGSGRWQRSLAEAIRNSDELIDALGLPDELRAAARRATRLFPVMVPRSYLRRMAFGDPNDPLLRQVLPLGLECDVADGFASDPVGDGQAKLAPGLLQKYHGRALMISTGACAVHCRYCFRRHYPYGEDPRRLEDWQPALSALRENPSIREAILSGGDPLMLTDHRLGDLIAQLEGVPHLTRLRIHSRLPIVLPDRVTGNLLDLLTRTRLRTVMVVHANHPAELQGDCAEALEALVNGGIPTLNQAVLLKRVNDDIETLAELCLRCVDLGVIPYYLHQLDRVQGAAHFEVSPETGRALVEKLRTLLPGYAVPRYVAEIAGAPSKSLIEQL